MPIVKTPEFLNVDLNLVSKSDLQPLVKEFGQEVFKFGLGRHDDAHHARLELAVNAKDADTAILRFCSLVRALPLGQRRSWDRAISRDFNIGVQVPESLYCHQYALAPSTVKAAAELKARIIFTIYGQTKLGKMAKNSKRHG